jgi:ElaB/YqjD/DUF883 family membrane-anchored ribosome-binding protein
MLNEARNILERLTAADRAHQKEAGGRFLLRAIKYVCAWVLVAFALDVALHLSAGWRLGLLAGTMGVLLGLAGSAWYLAFVRRNRLEHIARFLENRDPALGSRLINLLQLQEQTRDDALTPLTRELARQAIGGYVAELGGTPLERLAWTGELRRHFQRAAWALLGFAAALAAFFRVTAVEATRFADPFGDHPPYSLTSLEMVVPGASGTNVLYGKGLVVKATASGPRPKELFLTSFPPGHPEQAATVPMFDKGSVGYDQLVDNIRTELQVCAHTKDGSTWSRQAHIGVVLTPKLERAFARISAPAYTGLKPEENPYAFKGLQTLEGSEVRFRLQSNRPLRDGLIELICGDQPPQRVPLRKSADNEVAGSFIAGDSGRLRFSVADVAGQPSQDDWEGALTVTHDLPPEIRITEPEKDAFVAMDFKLQAHIEASDDYGLRTVRIHRGLNGVYSPPRVVAYEGIVRDSHEVVSLSLADLGLQPDDIISLFAEAVDTAPQPHLARSQTVRLKVISVEDYNNFLRAQTDVADAEAKYEALMDDLQQLIESQKQLGEAAEKLKGQVAKAAPKARDELARQLDELLARQDELNAKLNKHAERMDNFVRQNPIYDVEQDVQELLRQQAEAIRQCTRANTATGRDIARRSSPPTGPRQLSADMPEDFKRASDEQVARLGGVQEQTGKQVAETLEDMSQMQELLKDFNQFEALYQAQQELAAQTQAYNRAGQSSREDQLALKELAASEKQVGDLLNQLEQKLREDAQAAQKLFPKASKSGQDLADSIDELRLQQLARQATGQMLAGDGERSFNLAERLRGEMEKLFSQCQGGNCPSGNELDAYLKLQRSMNPGRNFAQMSLSRKFGRGGQQGMGMGVGQGARGSSGYAVMDGSTMNVLGNESSASRGSATARQSSRFGKGAGTLAGRTGAAETEKADVMKGLNPVNRQSGAVASETVPDEYSALVDTYFRVITTKKNP